jgi:hypothetical protein
VTWTIEPLAVAFAMLSCFIEAPGIHYRCEERERLATLPIWRHTDPGAK